MLASLEHVSRRASVRSPTQDTVPSDQPREGPRPLSLALQGGGALGAFTWGVLDRLLEENIAIDCVSGASAGAVNAVLLASGLAKGGAEGARQALDSFWTKLGRYSLPRSSDSPKAARRARVRRWIPSGPSLAATPCPAPPR